VSKTLPANYGDLSYLLLDQYKAWVTSLMAKGTHVPNAVTLDGE
jgi:hypothetical protein